MNEPYVQTPLGRALRCQARSKTTGQQCAKPARTGFRVCASHGAGTHKREREGTRQQARTASLTTGRHATPETLADLEGIHPEFRGLRDRYLADKERLRDLDALLADLWALRDVIARQLPTATRTETGEAPPVLLAVLSEIAAALERVARIEGRVQQRAGSVSIVIVQLAMNNIVEVLHEYIPADRIDAALAKIEQALARLDVSAGGGDTGKARPAG